ncbi:DegT/DnrJ/EryC1/StrS family aminotransferase [Chitinimonas sp. BJB300]|uniref:DegT/DnrJ/EryC1/StrS family aminotransferase n=1 Tax=Chitinimonas sp. BJB300 TaxID=1559339 RepID=UPI000C0C7AD1|nr:DegT/DnrJ/EryC1/StrS family aminotransferase [Chitinimonas sp. BJB300]PHV12482.1 DegT/DnrJ/EryC1/StrS aminotransferase [Chitinimonas sp. BJB300]TSJ89129.1 DegT/DnrJ/EryC1/StrS family aminotransferase [Chitinimonas sp. BJB300]
MTQQLALLGGQAVRNAPLPAYNTLGPEERAAVNAVLDSAVLSRFLGAWTPDFYGGDRVQALERAWERHFDIPHAVSMNSATSCLYAAVGALGIGPGDEVIVSPYTMSASAVAAVVYGAIPVFADIDPDTFCLSAATIAARITPRTKAIIVVDIFGQPADFEPIMALARQHGLRVIEDNAQGPGARYQGRYSGTLADIGVFSLNYHKTIHCGEGGIAVTADADLAERMRLIRNHAEAVAKPKAETNLVNLVGFNYRMTEIEAAIAAEQLKKLPALLATRQANAARLSQRLAGLPGISIPVVSPDVEHGWYVYAIKYDAHSNGVSRVRLAQALRAEGIPVGEGYVEPIYLQPMYQQRIAIGRDGFPFTYPGYQGELNYARGLCPVTERMHFETLLYADYVHASLTPADVDSIANAWEKVLTQLDSLREGKA